MSNENDPETPEALHELETPPAPETVEVALALADTTAPTLKATKRKLTPEQEADMRVYGRKEG